MTLPRCGYCLTSGPCENRKSATFPREVLDHWQQEPFLARAAGASATSCLTCVINRRVCPEDGRGEGCSLCKRHREECKPWTPEDRRRLLTVRWGEIGKGRSKHCVPCFLRRAHVSPSQRLFCPSERVEALTMFSVLTMDHHAKNADQVGGVTEIQPPAITVS